MKESEGVKAYTESHSLNLSLTYLNS